MKRAGLLVCLWVGPALVACNETSPSLDAQGDRDAYVNDDASRRDAVAPGADAAPDQTSIADTIAPDTPPMADTATARDLGPGVREGGGDQRSAARDAAADAAPKLADATADVAQLSPDAGATPDVTLDAAPLPPDQTTAADAAQASAPAISPSSGSYPWGQTVTITSLDSEASIYYTLDGSEPSSSSSLYGFPFALAESGTFTVKAIAIKAGLRPSLVSSVTYTIGSAPLLRVKTPQISPVGGIYDSDQVVTIRVATAGAVIRYTTDGSRPTQFSTVYAGPVLVGGDGTSVTITAIAMKTGMVSSEAASASYLISYPQVATPQLTPAGGTYEEDVDVTISVATPGAVIHYTTDGSKPLEEWELYTGTPIEVNGFGTTLTIKAIAYHEGMWAQSEIASETYLRGCLADRHDGGDGRCVASGTCVNGYHDGGDGSCVLNGQCVSGYHDDGTGACVVAGCATGYVYSGERCRVIFTAVSAGYYHSCGVKLDGNIMCWGSCGGGTCVAPTLPSGTTYTAVSAGSYSTCGLKSDGGITCWGSCGAGLCNVPTLPSGTTYTSVGLGEAFGCGLKSDGGIACWGGNGAGQCNVPALPSGTIYTAVSTGEWFTCGLRSNGSIACWGSNGAGQCNVPTPPSGTTYTAVSAGSYHTCGLRSDGSIACWGANGAGQCNVPTLPYGTIYTAVTASDYFSCGLRSDGSLTCWGANGAGQSNAPAGNDFVAVDGGYYRACALKSDGVIVCWGNGGTPP